MVDVYRDAGLTDHSRLDAPKSRGVEVREVAVIAETKRYRFRRRADDGVGSEIVMRRRARERGRCEMCRQHRVYLAGADGWNVAGHRDHAGTPFAREKAAAGIHAAGMSIPRSLGHNPRTDPFAKSRRMRIERHDHHAGQKPGAGNGVERVRQHGLGETSAFWRRQQARQPMLGAIGLLDRNNRPDVVHRCEASASAASSVTRASVSRSCRLVIRVLAIVTRAPTVPIPSASAWSTI